MSADNRFVSVPAPNSHISLYEVSASDSRINLEDPHHEACQAVVEHGKLRGTYESIREVEQALGNFYTEELVECL